MTDTNAPLPPPGPDGYQPSPGEGISIVSITVARDGTTVDLEYVFPQPRPTGEALAAIAELKRAIERLAQPEPQADVPPVAPPAPPAPDPAAHVRPPPRQHTPTLAAPPPGLEAMRAGAWGEANSTPPPPPKPDINQTIQAINEQNMGPGGPF